MGHSSTRAALIYLHSTSDRQRAVAEVLNMIAQSAITADTEPSGTVVACTTKSGSKVGKPKAADQG